jgi:hypothetical protein
LRLIYFYSFVNKKMFSKIGSCSGFALDINK